MSAPFGFPLAAARTVQLALVASRLARAGCRITDAAIYPRPAVTVDRRPPERLIRTRGALAPRAIAGRSGCAPYWGLCHGVRVQWDAAWGAL